MSDDEKEKELETIPDGSPSVIDPHEVLPATMFYRSVGPKRKRAKEIRAGLIDEEAVRNSSAIPDRPQPRFSTLNGVYMRCILNIISAVFYLRLGLVVANCGLLLAYVVILASATITTLTTLSMAALVTNGQVKGGGIYYFVGRSLGADFGATIGIIFAFATAFNSGLQIFGFIEEMEHLLGTPITKDGKWDSQIIGISVVTLQTISISLSLSVDMYFQYALSACIILSVLAIFFGPLTPTNPKWLVSNIAANLYPNWRNNQTFWTVFASFFPACCVIMSGANISGDLKDPQKSIPIGTLGAIWTTTGLYLIVATIMASAHDRDTLHNDTNALSEIAVWKPLLVAGILAGAMSSSASALVDGPKIFQAICRDDVLPKFFKFFAWGKKNSDDPVRGFILAWAIVVVSTFIFSDMDTVGSALTNFFCISYALVSLSCLIARMSKSPSWRPTWKFYHPITCILGAALCVAAMFLINWIFALSVIAIALVLFGYFHWNERTNRNWGEFPQQLLFTDTVKNIEKLCDIPTHVKTYRPVIDYCIDFNAEGVETQVRNYQAFQYVSDEARSLISVSYIGRIGTLPHVGNEGITYNDTGVDLIKTNFARDWGNVDLKTYGRLVAGVCGFGKFSPNVLAFSWVPNMKEQTGIYEMVASAIDARLGVAMSRNFESFEPTLDIRWPIDVWWMADDGGLLILFAYLLKQHSVWEKCELRIINTVTSQEAITDRQIMLTRLIHMFRIPAQIVVLQGMDKAPSQTTMNQWNDYELSIPDLSTQKKIDGYLRLREMMLENSGGSSLVLCSMPLPYSSIEPAVWLSILDYVSEAMPPFLWVHGNGENVVTFLA